MEIIDSNTTKEQFTWLTFVYAIEWDNQQKANSRVKLIFSRVEETSEGKRQNYNWGNQYRISPFQRKQSIQERSDHPTMGKTRLSEHTHSRAHIRSFTRMLRGRSLLVQRRMLSPKKLSVLCAEGFEFEGFLFIFLETVYGWISWFIPGSTIL